VLFIAALAILMVPYTTLLIPLYILLQWLGLQNSLVGLSLVLIMLQLPFGLFMMRNSFEALPTELEDAALVDGCSVWAVLVRVLLPGVIPGMVTVALFAFLASWNEFVAPLIFLSDGTKFTLPRAREPAQRHLRLGRLRSARGGHRRVRHPLRRALPVPAAPLRHGLQRRCAEGLTLRALCGNALP
jgi:ABC-type glycerol-3-phosphate transport system permease component